MSDLMGELRNAHDAGDTDAALKIIEKMDLMQSLRNAHDAGDTGAALKIIEKMEAQREDPSFIDKAIGAGEVALNMGTSGLADIAGGLSGLVAAANPLSDLSGADQVKFAQNLLTYDPRTKQGKNYLEAIGGNELVQGVANAINKAEQFTGDMGYSAGEATGIPNAGPVLGGMASAIPAAAGEFLGAGLPSRTAKKLSSRAKNLERAADDVDRVANERFANDLARPIGEGVEQSTDAGMQEVADALAGARNITAMERVKNAISNKDSFAKLADFDRETLRAADDLGFKEVPPGVAAANAQLRDLTMGVTSIKGGVAKAQYDKFIEEIGKKADELIKQGGGQIDKGVISTRFDDETTRIIESLGNIENDIYDKITQTVTPNKTVDVSRLRSHIMSKAAEFKGLDRMPRVYKDLAKIVFEKKGPDGKFRSRNPSYAEFDLKRKEIGEATQKFGKYESTESATIKNLYGEMKEQQRDIMRSNRMENMQDAADAVTIKKKSVQNAKTDLLGLKLADDLMPKLATRIKGLPSGNVKRFTAMMEKIPKNLRGPAAVSALNDILRGSGSDQKDVGIARFGGIFEDLNRSPTAKAALYKYLPDQTKKSFDSIGKLSQAVHRANKEIVNNGAIQQFFPSSRNFLKKAMSLGIGAVSTSMAGPAGSLAAEGVREFFENTTPKARKANEFLASKEFQDAMKASIRAGVSEGSQLADIARKKEKILKSSKKYKRWAETLDGESAAKLATVGVAGYFMTPDDEQETKLEEVE
tara:strand:+ start:6960 stop:9236 length:2277 start_codon:yes stop_codon:yes gene_type:complete